MTDEFDSREPVAWLWREGAARRLSVCEIDPRPINAFPVYYAAPTGAASAGEPVVAEDYCGVLQERSDRETRAGTKYSVCKWACPTCHSACSVLYIDDEWCHGDSLTIEFVGGAKTIKCGKCWLSATPPAPTGAAPPLTREAADRINYKAAPADETLAEGMIFAHGLSVAALDGLGPITIYTRIVKLARAALTAPASGAPAITERELAFALNYHGDDARINEADWKIARRYFDIVECNRGLHPSLGGPDPFARTATVPDVTEAAYKWGYEYLQSRMESIDRHGWAHDCDGEIEARISDDRAPTGAAPAAWKAGDEALILALMADADNYAQTAVECATTDRAGSERRELEANLRDAVGPTGAAP